MSRGRYLLLTGLVLLLALGLRFQHAAKRTSVWRDEAQDIFIVKSSGSVDELLTDRLKAEGHPPLHYLIEYWVQQRFGARMAPLRWMACPGAGSGIAPTSTSSRNSAVGAKGSCGPGKPTMQAKGRSSS